MLKVLVVDDHAVVREGVKFIVGRMPGFSVSSEASTGQEAIEKVRSTPCDVVVLDIGLPDQDGFEVLKNIRSERPNLPVLLFSMRPENQCGLRALRAGASGYLTKDRLTDNLVEAIRRVASGRRFLSPELRDAVVCGLGTSRDPHELLSTREYQVMCLLASGQSVGKIAVKLSLSANTISTYRVRLLQKLQLTNNAELIRFALRQSKSGRSGENLGRSFFKRCVYAAFSAVRAFQKELHRPDALSDSRTSGEKSHASFQEPASDQRIEAGYA